MTNLVVENTVKAFLFNPTKYFNCDCSPHQEYDRGSTMREMWENIKRLISPTFDHVFSNYLFQIYLNSSSGMMTTVC